ncbi:MAG: hypothetical protein PHX60_13425 [Giesbergeria sp.]|uniref:hypothetical protein n=1 Tax=Giesbergeria sp. TaxID=2818473 RepID=UPI0026240F30|nr:hypothetical protein [Giesbergeria sp.]MDD2610660.1 hypothetical protein [Giesbergeria sp.]
MSNVNIKVESKEKGHTAVSLPRTLAAQLSAASELSGRSAAKQIEHALRIAQAVEAFLPASSVNELKKGLYPANQLLVGLAAVLSDLSKSTALARIKEQNPSRIHFDPNDPTKAFCTQPDGSVVEGRLLDNGDFVPDPFQPQSDKEPKHGKKPEKKSIEIVKRVGSTQKVPEPA